MPSPRHTKSATILEVAELAAVSPSTVSNVLNGKTTRMSPATLERVMKAVSELGYAPNRMARGLKTGFVSIIGLIVPSVENPFWGVFARSVERAAMARNCQVMLCNGDRDVATEHAYAESMLSLGIRGVIIGSSPLSMKHLADLAKRGLKIVAFDRAGIDADGLKVDSVRVDNRAGITIAMRHLFALGHRRIAFIAGPINSANRIDRLAAYRQALSDKGAVPMPEWEWLDDSAGDPAAQPGRYFGDLQIGRKGALHIFSRQRPAGRLPTAVVAINDMTALGVLGGLRELGYAVPDDISVVGFDDIFLGTMSNPRLTTIRQPLDALMETAVSTLISRMDGSNTGAPVDVSMPAELTVRESSSQANELIS